RRRSSTRHQEAAMTERPETCYAKSGDVHIAYQVVGHGPLDLVVVPGFTSHLEWQWEHPAVAHFLERLASVSPVLLFDQRGTGLSDRMSGIPTLEQRMDDVRAVMDAVGSRRAAAQCLCCSRLRIQSGRSRSFSTGRTRGALGRPIIRTESDPKMPSG